VPNFVEQEKVSTVQYCYRILDKSGQVIPDHPCYETKEEALDNPPQWVLDDVATQEAQIEARHEDEPKVFSGWLFHFTWLKFLVSLSVGFSIFGLLYLWLMRNRDAQNLLHDTSDINQHQGDQYITPPDELIRKFEWFPDVGGHSSVQPSSMISHVMMEKKGLKSVKVARRASEDVLD